MSLLILFPKLGQEIEELVRNAQNVTKYLIITSFLAQVFLGKL